MPDSTPMMRQYAQIKRDHQDAILFFRLGDFYEMFKGDALEASRILGLTLTSRNGFPMCGIPYHASRGYIARLLRAGKKIAICEQTRLPEAGKGIADREVIEVVTPGTVTEEELLDRESNNFLAAIGLHRERITMAWVDLSTGEFSVTAVGPSDRGAGLRRELARLHPREILVQESLLESDHGVASLLAERDGTVVNRYPDWSFDIEASRVRLTGLLGVSNLKAFGIEDDSDYLFPCGVLIEYIEQTARTLVPHIRSIQVEHETDHLGIDESTLRNLEILNNLTDGGRRYSLLSVVDETKTSMGARLLKRWLLAPLRDVAAIGRRLQAVSDLYHDQKLLGALREHLSGFLDLERLCARVAMDRAHGKDLVAIRKSAGLVLATDTIIREAMPDHPDPPVVMALSREQLGAVDGVRDLLERSIADEPSVVLTEGNLIRSGFDERLDELHRMKDNSAAVLDTYLAEERERSGIGNLRIRYNRIIGHFLEVTKGNLDRVPEHFVRRQTLVGGDRFTTERLGELESELNSASERIVELERELFLRVREDVKRRLAVLQDASAEVARIDVLQSFAYVATVRGYSRPAVDESGELSIRAGRHPVVEANLPAGEFIPNDTRLSADGKYFALITGPNMAGKSTFLRQTALIVLLAQCGSFVPAEDARIGVVDRIFCRVGASDNLARGESTFLVEMNETAFILRSSTPSSLVIMDEVGRGTGTNDGLAIAQSVSEFILDSVRCRTLFATHYHELTDMSHDALHNLSLGVLERKGEIVFLKRVQEGPSSNSYGIHVARLAGLPEAVIARARELLASLLESQTSAVSRSAAAPISPLAAPEQRDPRRTERTAQRDLFSPAEILEQAIRSVDVTRTSPLEALNLISEWQEMLAQDRSDR